MSGYENAPATRMVATECAACSRPLVDAVSVETGMGPECRRKHGYADAQGPADWAAAFAACPDVLSPDHGETDARTAANRLVYTIACEQFGARVIACIQALHALGYVRLATRIADRVGSVHVETEGDTLLVRAPFSPDFNEAIRACRGQRWDRERKVRLVPRGERAALWRALRASFPAGTIVVGERIAVIRAA